MSNEELWEQTAKALEHGDFTFLNELLIESDASIIDLLEANGEQVDAMSEAFAWACFTNRIREAELLLDKGVDPSKSDKTGLSGFHWAASRGNVDTVRMLLRRNALPNSLTCTAEHYSVKRYGRRLTRPVRGRLK